MTHVSTIRFAAIMALMGWFAIPGLPRTSAGEPQHTKDTLDAVKKNITAKKAVLVDVREKSEWDRGHLRDAVLLPLSQIPDSATAKMLEKQFAKGQILYLHCAAGGRCLQAAELLKNSGYDVRPLRDGYQSLLKNGFLKSEK